MENPNNHQENEEEIQEAEFCIIMKRIPSMIQMPLIMKWERQMQEIWQEFNEAYAEDHVEEVVEEVKTLASPSLVMRSLEIPVLVARKI